jgi:hypothetical protein
LLRHSLRGSGIRSSQPRERHFTHIWHHPGVPGRRRGCAAWDYRRFPKSRNSLDFGFGRKKTLSLGLWFREKNTFLGHRKNFQFSSGIAPQGHGKTKEGSEDPEGRGQSGQGRQASDFGFCCASERQCSIFFFCLFCFLIFLISRVLVSRVFLLHINIDKNPVGQLTLLRHI